MAKQPGVKRIGRGHWELRIWWKDPKTGKYRETTRRFHGSQREAVTERDRIRAELEAPDGAAAAVRTTLGAWTKLWMKRGAKRKKKAVSTLVREKTALKRHILPELGDYYVRAITRRDVEAWLDRAVEKKLPKRRGGGPYKRSTINMWLKLLLAVVADFYREHNLGASPLARMQLLEEGPAERRKALTADEAGRLLRHLEGDEGLPHLHSLAFLGFTTGMRPGELVALRWEDLDEAEGVVHIRRTYSRGVITPTKSKRARRAAYTPEMVAVMREWRRVLVESQHPGLASGLVWPGRPRTRNYPYLCASALTLSLAARAEAAGLPVRFTAHMWRHTHINLCRQAGIDRLVIKATAGHASDDMTDHYSLVDLQEQAAAQQGVVRLLRRDGKT